MGPVGLTQRRLLPGKRLGWLLLALSPLAYVFGGLWVVLVQLAVLLGLAFVEHALLARALLHLERLTDARFVIGEGNQVTLKLHNAGATPLQLTLRDDYPDGWLASTPELSLTLAGHQRATLQYSVVPPRRGRFAFGDVHVRLEGRFGLGAMLATVSARSAANVYPNVRAPGRYELAARLGVLATVGVRASKRSGGSGELDHLREYVRGDAFRDLDWKSTAKRLRPMTRVYEQENSQTVILAIDCGRMMATQLGTLTKLDHAINAGLLLAFAALRQGDRVGLLVFAEDVHAFVPPARGQAQYQRILEALFAAEARPVSVEFRRLAELVRTRVPRRSLLVLFSDLLDASHALPLAEHAKALRGKHLALCVTLDDVVARALAEAKPVHDSDVYPRAAAADLLEEREAVKLHLTRSGVQLVEAPPGEIAVATVNRYLEIKASRAL